MTDPHRILKRDWAPSALSEHEATLKLPGYLYVVRRAIPSGRTNRFHLYALPDGGLPDPLFLGNTLTMARICKIVRNHQRVFNERGFDAARAWNPE